MIYLLGNISRAFAAYSRNPMEFMKASFYHALLQLIGLLAAFGVFMILLFAISLLDLQSIPEVIAAISFVAFIVWAYFHVSFEGAFIRDIYGISNASSMRFSDLYHYGLEKSGSFFGITIIRVLIISLLVVPLVLLYFFVLKDLQIPLLEQVLPAIVILEIEFVKFLLFTSQFHAAVSDKGAVASVKSSLGFIKQKHVFALVFFVLYTVVLVTFLVPILNLVTLLATYPIFVLAIVFSIGGVPIPSKPQMPQQPKPKKAKNQPTN